MRFEHLVAINDPDLPQVAGLSREQVWCGLMQRVEDARAFLPGLDRCLILARGEGMVERELHFGATRILDRVVCTENEWVRFETSATEHHGGGTLTVRIEEPQAGWLMLRFIYDTAHALGREVEDAAFEDYLRQAYEAADIDTVRIIRELAAGARH
jgi:hypothetical protein